ncbi:enhancer of polycomb homolog 1-like [Mercenaria mercenaria]|uniref:enhancer of polycomb homolog 1-like n=1 Tax=Mercenaria mercenaria TaxID=6596 RepID=UPI001E1DA555|nr:enhancer of polycomb homolog 1-like [Mercenaria mercenaria]
MSKVTFRARALDAARPMPVYKAEDIPDLPDFATINRSVPQMPTGMEKEEETEHHLQRALSAQQVYGTAESLTIPIPDVDDTSERYDGLYPSDFKQPKQFIHLQAFGMDQEIPDYDMDSEDEAWLNEQTKKMEITPVKFEEMLDRLEKGSGQQVVTIREAKLLLKEDDDLIIAVYDYWLNKRLRTQHPLILSVKTEKRDGSTTNNPYVAFRRRTEKMQTRKNRKNDETSYEKMLKLRRDLSRAVTLLEFVKRREKMKKEMLQLAIEVAEKRYNLEDYDGKMLSDAESIRHKLPPFVSAYTWKDWGTGEEVSVSKKKREYRKRKHKVSTSQQPNQNTNAQPVYNNTEHMGMLQSDLYSSDEDVLSPMSPSDHEDENDPDGMFAFKRKKNCSYYAPILDRLGNWPWCSPEEGGLGDKQYRYSLTSLSQPQRCIGFARRRVGRGGRILLDRGFSPWDDGLHQVDLSGSGSYSGILGDYVTYIRDKKVSHFRPHSPPPDTDSSHLLGPPSFTSSQDSEFNMDHFTSHQEQLLQMQREQQEQLLRHQTCDLDTSYPTLEHSFSSQPTSRFTLDTASAKFAVSAVINSTQVQQQQSATSTATINGASSIATSTVNLLNGPINAITENKSQGLSTSPAANILQLNFPLNNNNNQLLPATVISSLTTSNTAISSHTSSLSSSSSSPSLSSTVPASTVLTTINNLAGRNSFTAANLYKLAASQNTVLQTSIKQNHEDAKSLNNLNIEKVLPMDVT